MEKKVPENDDLIVDIPNNLGSKDLGSKIRMRKLFVVVKALRFVFTFIKNMFSKYKSKKLKNSMKDK